jgi:hypothetical protein
MYQMGVGLNGQLPVAGWYADPADARGERWWSGTEWSQITRALESAPQPTPASYGGDQPQYAGVPGGNSVSMASGVPQFAGVSDSPWSQQEESPAVTSWDANSTAGFNSFGANAGPTQPHGAVSAGWYSQNNTQSYGPPPSNGIAIASFVLSLFGFGLLAVIFGVMGLRRARELEASGQSPVGRGFAQWGIGIAIVAGFIGILSGIALAITLPELQSFGYNKAAQETAVSNQEFQETGVKPTSVECPVSAPTAAGTTFECVAHLPDGSTVTYTIAN